jgi:hypothetical protein
MFDYRFQAIRRPVLGKLDQGLIFTCARSEDYPDAQVWGVSITARCDLAHDKAPIFNYLPIVSLNDWMQQDGRLIICHRALRQTTVALQDLLKANGFSSTILSTQPPRKVAEVLFPMANTKPARKCLDLAGQYERLSIGLSSKLGKGQLRAIIDSYSGISRALIMELTSNALNGFYFLPRIAPDGDDLGYVVILREVRHLPRTLARLVAQGLSQAGYEDLCKLKLDLSERLRFAATDFAMPIGLLASPAIEHLVQVFSLLFSRIGLEDMDGSYRESLLMRQPILKGDDKCAS